GKIRHSRVEVRGLFWVPCHVGKGIHAKDMIKCRRAGPHAVKHVAPSLLCDACKQERCRTHRSWHAGSQAFSERSQRKATVFLLGKHSDACQEAQHSCERFRMRSGRLRQRAGWLRAVGEQVGNPECGSDVDRARDIVTGYHLEESHCGRYLFSFHRHCPSFELSCSGMPWLGRCPVLICQGACKLNGIGTLLQPNDQPVLQCPHVSETSGEPLAGSSGTPRIAAEGDDAFG